MTAARDPVLDAYLRERGVVGRSATVRSITRAARSGRADGRGAIDERCRCRPSSSVAVAARPRARGAARRRVAAGRCALHPGRRSHGASSRSRCERHDAPAIRCVCDPAVGGGAFLLAAAESLAAEGLAPIDVVRTHCSVATSTDVAVDVTRSTLALWAGEWPDELDEHIVVADACAPTAWDRDVRPGDRQPAVPGPARSDARRAAARRGCVRTSADAAVSATSTPRRCSSSRALELTRPGGRVALVQPHSTLAARDAASRCARPSAGSVASALWFTEEQAFDAGVRVWAPVIERGTRSTSRPVIRRVATRGRFAPVHATRRPGARARSGPSSSPISPASPLSSCARRAWSATSRPPRPASATSTTASSARFANTASADDDRPRLVTSGLLERARHRVGVASARVRRRDAGATRWCTLDALDAAIARWVQTPARPEARVATQTKVIEVAVDETDRLRAEHTGHRGARRSADHLWLLAAALSSPPITALACACGSASGAVGRRGEAVGAPGAALPLPADDGAWEEAADVARRRCRAPSDEARRDALAAFGAASCRGVRRRRRRAGRVVAAAACRRASRPDMVEECGPAGVAP